MCIWILTFVRPALVVLPAISFTASAILEEIMSGLTGITLRLNTGLEKWLFFLALQMNKGMTCKWNWKVRRDPGAQKGEHLWITGVLILSSFYSHFLKCALTLFWHIMMMQFIHWFLPHLNVFDAAFTALWNIETHYKPSFYFGFCYRIWFFND